MKILVLVTDAFGGHGGIATFNQAFLSAISSMENIDVVSILPRLGKPTSTLPVKLKQNNQSIKGFRAYLTELTKELLKKNYDLVICGHINLLPFSYIAKLRFNAPLALIIHGIDVDKAKERFGLQYFAQQVDHVISVSQITLDKFQTWAPLKKGSSSILPNCVDLDRFTPGNKPPYLLDRYNIHNKKVLMTFGRLAGRERQKGFDEVLEALPELLKSNPNLIYMIAGDGSDKKRLQEKAQLLGIKEFVIFAGRIDENEKVDHYRAADLYVMPSRGEGFGIVILEALACGIPVIGSSKDGTREALLNGKLGELVDPSKINQLTQTIHQQINKKKSERSTELGTFSSYTFPYRVEKVIRKLIKI